MALESRVPAKRYVVLNNQVVPLSEASGDEDFQYLWEDYLGTAEYVRTQRRKAEKSWMGYLAVTLILSLLICYIVGYFIVGWLFWTIMGFPIMIYLVFFKSKTFENKLAETISLRMPGFSEFYREWRKHKNREAMLAALAIGLGAVASGIASAAADSSDKARVRRAVNDELNRRGL